MRGMTGHRHEPVLVPSAGERALSPEQRAERDRLEVGLDAVRAKRQQLGDAAYYEQGEALRMCLDRLYAQAVPPVAP